MSRDIGLWVLALGGVLAAFGALRVYSIVFADADLDSAVENAYRAMFANAGQNCQAGSRLLVERAVSGEFLARLRRRVQVHWSRRRPQRR